MRRARDIWVQIIRQYEKSHLTQEAFAEQRHIPVGTLRSWIYRLRRQNNEATGGSEATSILPVRVIASTAPAAREVAAEGAPAIELILSASMRLRFPPSTAPRVIAELVTLLRNRC